MWQHIKAKEICEAAVRGLSASACYSIETELRWCGRNGKRQDPQMDATQSRRETCYGREWINWGYCEYTGGTVLDEGIFQGQPLWKMRGHWKGDTLIVLHSWAAVMCGWRRSNTRWHTKHINLLRLRCHHLLLTSVFWRRGLTQINSNRLKSEATVEMKLQLAVFHFFA